MKKTWKLISLIALCAAFLGLAVACTGTGGEQTEPPAPQKVTLRLAGETAGGDGAYSLSLEEGNEKTYTVVVGDLTDYTLSAVSSAPAVAAATATNTTLKVSALQAGSAVVTLSEAGGKANELKLNVTVTAGAVQKVVPTNVVLAGTTGGSGTADEPYTVAFSTNAASTHNIVVQPKGAESTFTYKVGALADGVFTEDASSALTATQEGTVLTLASATAGEYAVQATSTAGEYTFYVKATVAQYTALTAIETNLTESEDEGFDYVFKTAKGTAWDMTNGISARGQNLLDGSVFGGYQKPLNATYFPNLPQIELTPVPAEATSKSFQTTSTDEEVFKLNADGSWEAGKAGTAEITVTNTAEEASIKIKVTVEDTIAEGVLKSEYDEAEADAVCNWGFDENNPDSWTEETWNSRKGMYEAWHLVMNKTIAPNGDDGNQKFFYLGNEGRIYGVCLETQSKSSSDTVLALAWAKVTVPAQATTITMFIGNNDKTQGKYRVLFVDGTTGEQTDLSNGWVNKTKPNDDGKPAVEYSVEALRGKTGALILQAGQNEQNNNCELHFKGAWINGYEAVTAVKVEPASGSVGQGGTVQINATVEPATASHKELKYEVTKAPEGGTEKLTVSADGSVTVAEDAPTGEYTVTVTSQDNAAAKAEFTLTVTAYQKVTSFEIGLEYGGREIDAEPIANATLELTFDANGIFTDPALKLDLKFNDGASVQDCDVTFGTQGILSYVDGKLTAIAAGQTTVTVTPKDNAALAVTFTVHVSAFDESTSLIEGTKVTKTFAALMGVDESTGWNDKAGYEKFVFATVDKRHSNAKLNYDGDQMQLENHVTVANSNDPVNIGYNKVHVEKASYLTFEVRGHGDDRYLESANLRVRVLYLEGSAWKADVLLKWTTVANRWKQQNEWYRLALDLSNYVGKDVIVLFEAVGGLQNNGNFPKDSDSSAGGYLYLRNIAIGEKGEGIAPVNGEIAEESLRRMYANNGLAADGWEASANKDAGSYKENVYQPLTLTYTGSLDAAKPLTLTTTTIYSNAAASSLYPWGVFPALNNTHEGHEVEYVAEADKESVFTLAGGTITPVGNGEGTLTVKAYAYGSDTEKVTFTVKIVIAAKSFSVKANTAAVSIEAGSSYTLDYTTVPEQQPVTFTVTEKPEGAKEGTYEVKEGVFETKAETAPGKYVVTIAMKDHAEAAATVEITVLARVTLWENKGAIIDPNTGWKVNGDWDSGVGEGADILNGGYLSRSVTVGEGEKLTVCARTFVRPGETNAKMYVAVIVDGQEAVRLDATKGQGNAPLTTAENHTVVIDTTNKEFEKPQGFIYDLSQFAGKKVEIRIGVDVGTHCAITSIQLAK